MLMLAVAATLGCGTAASKTAQQEKTNPKNDGRRYSLEQAMSDNAQLSTIAFSGLAFITGNSGADSFMPPGKVADFFGFQYMRDVDTAGYGHNSQFLTRAANNVLQILTAGQKAQLVAAAKEQAPLYGKFAYNRFAIMKAFRRNLNGDLPAGSTGLSIPAVAEYCGSLYRIDAELSYTRAVVLGKIAGSFNDEQKAQLARMRFDNFSSWPDVPEDESLKRSMTHDEHVAVMTYASELFSWYKGGVEADTYFCPERHGTYFGGFFLKDYPAMNNPGHFISTSMTGDLGKAFLDVLNSEQRALIRGIIDEQRPVLGEIARIRRNVAVELRKAMAGERVDKEQVYSWIARYGQLDGQLSALYASRFAAVNKTLSESQREKLVVLRNLAVVPPGAYRFSTPVSMPDIPNTDFLFGVGSAPLKAAQVEPPQNFLAEVRRNGPDDKDKRGKPGDKLQPGKRPPPPGKP